MRRRAVALMLVALVGGCVDADDGLPADARVRIDTVDGVPHVISGNRGRWLRGGSWRVVEDGALLIGEVDGPEPYTFGRVAGLVVGQDGRVYVADEQASEVRVFSADGEFLDRFGRQGEGPGEFRDISGLSRTPRGVAVMDGRLGRLSVFSTEGDLVRTFRLQRPYMILEQFAVMGFDDEGRFYDRARLSGAPMVDSLGVISYARDGTPADTLHVATIEQDHLLVERDGVPIMSFPRPFAPQPSLAIGPEGHVYFTRGDEYQILVLSPAGDTVRVLRRELRPRPVTAGERDSALALIEERYREAAGGGAPRGVTLPETKPMISDLHVDRAGNLWVAAVPEPSWRRLEWSVHDPDGRYLGPIATPLMAVTDIGHDYVAGVQSDELGVQRAAVYRLER